MADTTRLTQALQKRDAGFERADPVYLGYYVAASTVNPGYHVVDVLRPDGSLGERREARGKVRPWPGVIVRLTVHRKEFGPDELVIVGIDPTSYTIAGSAPPCMLELHGFDHGFLQMDEIPNLHPLQLYPVRAQVVDGTLTVRILPGLYWADGAYRRLELAIDTDLTGYVPAVNRRYTSLSLDADKNVNVTAGSVKNVLTAADIPAPPATDFRVAAVSLAAGDTEITRERLEDLRYVVVGGDASSIPDGAAAMFNALDVELTQLHMYAAWTRRYAMALEQERDVLLTQIQEFMAWTRRYLVALEDEIDVKLTKHFTTGG